MIRKGRPLSGSGRYPGGPRDPADESPHDRGSSAGAPPDHLDSFDPFESFDAHDRAAGRGPQRTRSTSSRSSPASASADFSEAPAETTYTRSRRQPGEAKPGQSADEPSKSQRPTRSLKGRALGYLSRREYSRAELARKLKPYVEETDSLDTVLDSLEAENWLSDSRFAESLVHRRASRLGTSRILGELKQHALNPTLVEEATAQLRETELTRAHAVWNRKFGQLPQTPAERAKQARFLASRGFSGATIGKILKGIEDLWEGG
ncbi:recombination regulator RecX [Burkholderia sp. SRS-W-2-2016]|uniref:recombination regulator RecX n=1 Tax=Burkholderia sp. SRS-W-2-2016 TaxID=1926878 RepID=UPI00094AC4F2|nr:recombination regulator RecX [Burkholderia sp. SRS-W-2-2016]OLL29783.1 recombination regulator RecX [Burkholderia sp. SRS-W-2-2016]